MNSIVQYIVIGLSLVAFSQSIRVAVLGNGDVTDLGWSYMVNLGRVAVEKTLGFTNTTFVPNIDTDDKALRTFRQLASEGYDLMIGTTFPHNRQAAVVCAEFPKQFFIRFNGAASNCTNLASIDALLHETFYMMGYFAGLMTQNGKVGMVVPGSNSSSGKSINTNMFYVGMNKSNPQAHLYLVGVDTLLDPDRSAGAAHKLLDEIGVDMLAQQQDDLTVPQAAMNASLLAFGTTGIPLSTLYGQSVGMSIIRDWNSTFLEFTLRVMENRWFNSSKWVGSFKSGMFKLDEFSFRVPQTVKDQMAQELAFVIANTNKITCGPQWTELNPGTDGCLTKAQIQSGRQDFRAITFVGNYTVPTTEVPLSDSSVVGLSVVIGICLTFCLIFGGAIVLLRNAKVIYNSSPAFLELILVGGVLIYISVLLRLPTQTASLCAGTVWTASLGFAILFGTLFAKNYRIWRIFDNPKLQNVRVKDWELFVISGVIVLIDVIILIIWNTAGSVVAVHDFGRDGLGKYEYHVICTESSTGDVLIYLMVAYLGAIVALGCFISFETRIVKIEDFNESKPIALAIYNVAFATAIVIPVLLVVQEYFPRVLVFCAALIFSTSVALGALFLPKFYSIHKHGFNDIAEFKMKRRGTDTGSTSVGDTSKVSSSVA